MNSTRDPLHGCSAARPFRIAISLPLFVMLLFAGQNALANISASERTALLDLYASTNGSQWINSAGWGGGVGTECAWFGVTCAPDGNSVEQLSLANNQLSGPLPSNLQDLSSLTLLFLGNNAITGSIPPLAGMQELRDFAIGSNLLSGPIPPINALTHLSSFDVGNNQLNGNIPDISGLTALYLFDLSDNHIGGGIPALSNLPLLASFNVSDNQLTGHLPSLAGLTNLHSFYVSDNQLGGPAPALPSPNALTANGSRLCPNLLQPSTSPEWDAATGTTPWYLNCADDTIFRNGFDSNP